MLFTDRPIRIPAETFDSFARKLHVKRIFNDEKNFVDARGRIVNPLPIPNMHFLTTIEHLSPLDKRNLPSYYRARDVKPEIVFIEEEEIEVMEKESRYVHIVTQADLVRRSWDWYEPAACSMVFYR